MLEKGKPEYATILAFDVKVDSEARSQVYMDIYVCAFLFLQKVERLMDLFVCKLQRQQLN